ncbi:type II toxin-antitoxin system mRNA interferase toxin, RelE/StbE family [Eggerthellaceae bacterium zg-886]|uniref:Type II toxin-antitoxin system mRNA interferase toxin, RelE/StbE family n=1 Tax=Xiamenia xianingshaonis TaxID=2682776 RepID=A0ABX0IFN8_9ACTN|nr:type II toxin-antitoxin system mRNA interferase toxin, RelE/StbE family [Xiamenia xianingshaonis]
MEPLPSFVRDVKRLLKRHADITKLNTVVNLIAENTAASIKTLEQHHSMHVLKGPWKGHHECHVCNAGDWLLIWVVDHGVAYLERTGSHDELFR